MRRIQVWVTASSWHSLCFAYWTATFAVDLLHCSNGSKKYKESTFSHRFSLCQNWQLRTTQFQLFPQKTAFNFFFCNFFFCNKLENAKRRKLFFLINGRHTTDLSWEEQQNTEKTFLCAPKVKMQTAFENTGLCCSNVYLYEGTFVRMRLLNFRH